MRRCGPTESRRCRSRAALSAHGSGSRLPARPPVGSAPAARTARSASVVGADGSVGSPDAPRATSPTSATDVSSYPRPPAQAAAAAGPAVSPARTPRSAPGAPRRNVPCARCGQDKPPVANWAEGPVCDPCYTAPCYTAALRHRGTCGSCLTQRRLVSPPGPDATTCADCAGLPASHVCTDCGLEDKLYQRGRCERCTLVRRTGEPLHADDEQIPSALVPIHDAITATSTPRTALNWLRNGAGAAVLADLAAGTTPISHAALDAHPRRRGADYLRHVGPPNTTTAPRCSCQPRRERPERPPTPTRAGPWSPASSTTTPWSSPTGSPAPSCSATASSCLGSR